MSSRNAGGDNQYLSNADVLMAFFIGEVTTDMPNAQSNKSLEEFVSKRLEAARKNPLTWAKTRYEFALHLASLAGIVGVPHATAMTAALGENIGSLPDGDFTREWAMTAINNITTSISIQQASGCRKIK